VGTIGCGIDVAPGEMSVTVVFIPDKRIGQIASGYRFSQIKLHS
jgi:hypothetical protein